MSTTINTDLADHRLISPAEAADILGISASTLRTWRSTRPGYGPRAVKVGGSLRYRLTDLTEWIAAHVETGDAQ